MAEREPSHKGAERALASRPDIILAASGRIDGMTALAMALAAAPPTWTTPIDVAALIG